MTVPKFITMKGSSHLTDKPFYVGLVQHESVMTRKETYAHLAAKLKFSEANIRAAFRAFAEVLKANAANGMISLFDEVASVRNVVKGSFSGSNGPWVKGKNLILVTAVELDPFKNTLLGVIPTNKTEGVQPVIKSVLDNVTGVYDVIVGMNEFTLAGTDLGPDAAKEDEYVGVIAADGTLVKATLLSSELNVVKAKFESALEAGEYTLIVATRSGFGGDVAVKSATRKVMVG